MWCELSLWLPMSKLPMWWCLYNCNDNNNDQPDLSVSIFIKKAMLAKYCSWAQLSFQWSWFGWNLSGQLYRRGTIMSNLMWVYSMLKRVSGYFEFLLWKLSLQQKLSKRLSPVQQYSLLLWRRDWPRCWNLFQSFGGSADWMSRELFE